MRIVEGNWADWSEALFDTGIYLKVWEQTNRITEEQTRKEVAGIKKLLDELGVGCNAEILDVGGGYGRIAIPLAQTGERVHILERSPLHCQIAGERICEAGLCEGKQICVHNCDCREVANTVRGKIAEYQNADAAINIFTSVLGYYGREDDLAVLCEIRELLQANAPFIIDTINIQWILRHFQNEGVEWAKDRSWVMTEERRFDPTLPGTVSDFVFAHLERGDIYNFEMRHRMYDQASLTLLLQEAGFEAQQFYGSWDFEKLIMDSKRVICVARKS